jgi:hypothetical protein
MLCAGHIKLLCVLTSLTFVGALPRQLSNYDGIGDVTFSARLDPVYFRYALVSLTCVGHYDFILCWPPQLSINIACTVPCGGQDDFFVCWPLQLSLGA